MGLLDLLEGVSQVVGGNQKIANLVALVWAVGRGARDLTYSSPCNFVASAKLLMWTQPRASKTIGLETEHWIDSKSLCIRHICDCQVVLPVQMAHFGRVLSI